jgi:hypothetical protein
VVSRKPNKPTRLIRWPRMVCQTLFSRCTKPAGFQFEVEDALADGVVWFLLHGKSTL